MNKKKKTSTGETTYQAIPRKPKMQNTDSQPKFWMREGDKRSLQKKENYMTTRQFKRLDSSTIFQS